MEQRTTDVQTLAFDKRRLRARFTRAVATYDDAAVLHRTVAGRLIERLDQMSLQPEWVLDLGCGTGFCTRSLARRYRRARVVGIDLAWQTGAHARRAAGWFTRSRFVAGDAEQLPFADASFDLVLSNLMLPWCDPAAVFAQCARVLRSGGAFVFTSVGPDTLQELRAAWSAADREPHVHPFLDLRDLGDLLARAGFVDPVMDVERYTLTYADVDGVLRELKALGANNAHPLRRRGLMARVHFDRFRSAYAGMAREGRVPATCEVIYGYARAAPAAPADGRRVIKIRST